jgi:selenide,water dikinase
LVGIESSDDAAVYRINDELAIIQTLDFFTPVVDDPYVFGQIAAANSLSDIYAMGGEPKLALNIVCFPDCLDPEVLTQIMKGGHDKVTEAGAILVGGHSVSDDEPKYGLSVTGFVHPEKVQANNNAKAGDLLVLTKPLGIGIITTAIKGELASENARDKAILSMSTLNSYGKMALDATENVHSVTDITGFGLLGHSLEMAEGSGVTIKIYGRSVPYIQEAKEYSQMGLVPEGAYNNRRFIGDKIKIDESIPEYLRDILYDPQTSGGLLISVARENVDQLLEGLSNSPVEFGVVGEVMPKEEKQLIVE